MEGSELHLLGGARSTVDSWVQPIIWGKTDEQESGTTCENSTGNLVRAENQGG